MVTYLSKKSYLLKNYKEVDFKDLWGDRGIFTTMWIYDNPPKILFFKNHLENLLKSLTKYKLNKPNLKKNILKLLKENINYKKKYNHLLRIAINKKLISISLRTRYKTKLNFNLKLVNFKRFEPQYKNLKYKFILKQLSKLDGKSSDIALCNKGKILETGTSNILFVKDGIYYSPIKDFYEGITLKFFSKKIKKIVKKDIFIKDLNNFDEIILIGSGKGVTSVRTINNNKWKRKSLKSYKILKNYFNQAIKENSVYK